MNIGPTSIAFDPWTPVEGYGDLETIEAARIDFLERYGLLGGVRTHANSAANVMGEIAEPLPEAHGVIRVRPERGIREDLASADR
jgi:hypothetical protein